MGYLKAYYENFVSLKEKDWKFISGLFRKRVFKKGDIISHQGKKEQYLSFMERGLVRYFIPGLEELTFNFNMDKEFVCAYDSFITRQQSTYSIQAIDVSVLWSISYSDLQKVYEYTSVGHLLGRYAAENFFLFKSQRELLLLRFSAKEYYEYLIAHQPEIIQQIPLKYIASYIGITPQALSRIRKEIS